MKLWKKLRLVFVNKKEKAEELRLLIKQLEMQQKIKSVCVNEQNFEAARWYRDKEKMLQEKIDKIKSTYFIL